jgi:hypothetical protein
MAKVFVNIAKTTDWNPIKIAAIAYSSVCTSKVTPQIVLGPGKSHTPTNDPTAIRKSPGFKKSQRGL